MSCREFAETQGDDENQCFIPRKQARLCEVRELERADNNNRGVVGCSWIEVQRDAK